MGFTTHRGWWSVRRRCSPGSFRLMVLMVLMAEVAEGGEE